MTRLETIGPTGRRKYLLSKIIITMASISVGVILYLRIILLQAIYIT